MSWECAECGVTDGREGVVLDVVCHHCGKPLCLMDRIELSDDVFARGVTAFHCRACKQEHHPRVRPFKRT